jgi:hypothetical protein
MRRRGDLTIIVSRSAERPARRFRISQKFLIRLGIALGVLVSSFSMSTLHYYNMWKKTADHEQLKVSAYELSKENDTFRLAARQLSEKVSSLEVTSTKLQILSGLDEAGLGGVGGPSAYDNPLLSLNTQGLRNHFRSLEQKSISLDKQADLAIGWIPLMENATFIPVLISPPLGEIRSRQRLMEW